VARNARWFREPSVTFTRQSWRPEYSKAKGFPVFGVVVQHSLESEPSPAGVGALRRANSSDWARIDATICRRCGCFWNGQPSVVCFSSSVVMNQLTPLQLSQSQSQTTYSKSEDCGCTSRYEYRRYPRSSAEHDRTAIAQDPIQECPTTEIGQTEIVPDDTPQITQSPRGNIQKHKRHSQRKY
jgi:hypothetical protein